MWLIHVTLTQSEAICAFGIRNKLARTPADAAAFAPINPVTLKLNAAFWGRALTAIRDGGQGIVAFNPHSVPSLHDFIRSIPAAIPNPFLVQAADWAPFPAFALAGAPAARLALGQVRYLSLANVGALEIQFGPMAASAPWTFICKLAGALGGVGTQAARHLEVSAVQAVAGAIRANSAGGGSDGALASDLLSNLQLATLPKIFRAHGATPGEQSAELIDGFTYKRSAQDRMAVEQKRVDHVRPW